MPSSQPANQPTNKPLPTLALLCQHFYPEMVSTGLHMTELTTALAERGHTLRVYCARPSYPSTDEGSTTEQKLPRRDSYQGVEIFRLPTLGDPRGALPSRGLFALSYLLATIAFLVAHRRQIEGIVTTTNPPFIGLAAVTGKRLLGLRFVTIVYDVYPEIAVRLGALRPNAALTRLWQRFTGLILQDSNRLVVIGRDMAEIVAAKVPADQQQKITLIPNWSDEQRVYPVAREENAFARDHNPPGTFVVQYAGRMGRTHNLEPLLEAAHLMREEPVLFQFVGDGAKRHSLRALARMRNLTNVQFLPYQPFDRLHQLLSAPHLAVVCLDTRFTGLSVPSKSYGMMAAGRPLLAFLDARSEIGRVIEETECGIVLADPDGAAIVQAIRQLMEDEARLERMGHNAREAFLGSYTLSHAVDGYQQLLQETFCCYNEKQ